MSVPLPELVPTEQISAAAQWINSTFQNFDYKIMEFYHSLHEGAAGPFLDKFIGLFTRLGDGGIFLILIALILMLFKKSRKIGFGMLGGVVIGALFTNVCIKNVVARPRPYCTTELYRQWWASVGHGLESEYSFPSGHTTVAMDTMLPIFLFCNKKKSWLVFLFVIALGASRNYIMVHFPSDILGGIIIGGIAGLLSYLIVQAVYDKICQKGKLGNFIGNADIRNLFRKKSA